MLGVEVVRLTLSAAFVETRPELAASMAPKSPTTIASTAMTQIGQAAARGGDPAPETLDRLQTLAAVAPLRPEPFLVQAALAERAADYGKATALLNEARRRDPRSPAARYLIADVSLRQGKVLEGLREMAVLSRLLPGTSVQLVPALSEYARKPGAEKNLASILAENRQLRNPLFEALAADPDNAKLILALAGSNFDSRIPDTRRWQVRLLDGLVARGDFDGAYALWRTFARLREMPRPLLFNGDFRDLAPPPPFNWDFSDLKTSVAEPENGRLRILYYGRENAVLASQLLLLSPGSYRLEAPVSGRVAPQSLAWTLKCLGGTPLLTSWVGTSSNPADLFTVPASGCGAQKLELTGRAQDAPQDSDVHIGPVAIERAGG